MQTTHYTHFCRAIWLCTLLRPIHFLLVQETCGNLRYFSIFTFYHPLFTSSQFLPATSYSLFGRLPNYTNFSLLPFSTHIPRSTGGAASDWNAAADKNAICWFCVFDGAREFSSKSVRLLNADSAFIVWWRVCVFGRKGRTICGWRLINVVKCAVWLQQVNAEDEKKGRWGRRSKGKRFCVFHDDHFVRKFVWDQEFNVLKN